MSMSNTIAMWYTHKSFKAGRVVRVWPLKVSLGPILVLKTGLTRLRTLNTTLCNTNNLSLSTSSLFLVLFYFIITLDYNKFVIFNFQLSGSINFYAWALLLAKTFSHTKNKKQLQEEDYS